MAKQVAFGKEGTWNSAQTPNKVLEATSENLRIEKTPIEIEAIRAPSTLAVETDQERVIGDISAICNYQEVQLWAYMFLGTSISSGAGPYTHTIPHTTNGVDGDTKSWTVEVERSFTAFTYPGLMMTALGLDVQRGQALGVRSSWKGPSDNVATAAATSLSFQSTNVGVPRQSTVNIDASGLNAQSFTLDCTWDVDDPQVLGNPTYGVQPQRNARLAVSFTLTYIFANLTDLYNAFVNNTEIDVQLDCQTAADEALTINLNKCRIIEHSAPTDGRNRYIATARGISYFDTTGTENMQFVVVNDQAVADFSA